MCKYFLSVDRQTERETGLFSQTCQSYSAAIVDTVFAGWGGVIMSSSKLIFMFRTKLVKHLLDEANVPSFTSYLGQNFNFKLYNMIKKLHHSIWILEYINFPTVFGFSKAQTKVFNRCSCSIYNVSIQTVQ